MASFTGFGVLKEWFGASGEFLKVVLVPKLPPKPDASKEVLEKWLGFQFQMMVIAQVVYVVYWVLSAGLISTGITNAISYCIFAFVNAWIFWFGFAKREPPCCCLIQGFKYQHLIVGIYFMLTGISALLNAARAIGVLSSTMNLIFFSYIGFVVVYAIQVVAQIGSGWCMVKMGGKAAGIEIPDAPTVGKAGP
jgi:hypothetical protein